LKKSIKSSGTFIIYLICTNFAHIHKSNAKSKGEKTANREIGGNTKTAETEKPKDRKTKNLNGEDRIGEPNRRRQKVH